MNRNSNYEDKSKMLSRQKVSSARTVEREKKFNERTDKTCKREELDILKSQRTLREDKKKKD